MMNIRNDSYLFDCIKRLRLVVEMTKEKAAEIAEKHNGDFEKIRDEILESNPKVRQSMADDHPDLWRELYLTDIQQWQLKNWVDHQFNEILTHYSKKHGYNKDEISKKLKPLFHPFDPAHNREKPKAKYTIKETLLFPLYDSDQQITNIYNHYRYKVKAYDQKKGIINDPKIRKEITDKLSNVLISAQEKTEDILNQILSGAAGEVNETIPLFPYTISKNASVYQVSRRLMDNLNRFHRGGGIYDQKEKKYISADSKTALKIDDPEGKKIPEDLFSFRISRFLSAKGILLTHTFADYCFQHDSFSHEKTPLTDLMELYGVPKTKQGYYTTEQKEEFTADLLNYSGLKFYYDIKQKGSNKLYDTYFFDIIRITRVTHAENRKGDIDRSRIYDFDWEFLPDIDKSIVRGRIYPRDFREKLKASQPAAVKIGNYLLTRFDQIRQTNKGFDIPDSDISYSETRQQLIEIGGLQKTNENNPRMANKKLINSLEVLKGIVLESYRVPKNKSDDKGKYIFKPYPYVDAIRLDPIDHFKIPTIEQVKQYVNENNLNVRPREFIEYYEKRNWIVSKKRMRNWKAVLDAWHEDGGQYDWSKDKILGPQEE